MRCNLNDNSYKGHSLFPNESLPYGVVSKLNGRWYRSSGGGSTNFEYSFSTRFMKLARLLTTCRPKETTFTWLRAVCSSFVDSAQLPSFPTAKNRAALWKANRIWDYLLGPTWDFWYWQLFDELQRFKFYRAKERLSKTKNTEEKSTHEEISANVPNKACTILPARSALTCLTPDKCVIPLWEIKLRDIAFRMWWFHPNKKVAVERPLVPLLSVL